MKRLIALLLIIPLSGCATMRRHPVATGLIAGAAVGITVGVLTRGHGHCPSVYDGHPYSGTPPCPQDYPDSKRR